MQRASVLEMTGNTNAVTVLLSLDDSSYPIKAFADTQQSFRTSQKAAISLCRESQVTSD